MYIGNPPVVQSNRLISEELVSVQGKTAFYPAGGYTPGQVDVEINGQTLGSADFTATDGSVITLAIGCGVGDFVRIVAYGTATLANAVPANGSVTQAKLAANVAGNGPAFSAYQSSVQTFSNATFTKVDFQTEEFDTNNNFASSRFTPTVAGYYQIGGGLFLGTTNGVMILEIRKNGTPIKRISGSTNPANAFNTTGGSALVYLNGVTDYAELYFYQSSGGSVAVPFAQADLVYFQAAMVRSAT